MHWYSSGVSGSTLNCSITSVSSPAESRSPRRNVLGSLPSQSAKSIASYHLRSGWVTLDSIGHAGSGGGGTYTGLGHPNLQASGQRTRQPGMLYTNGLLPRAYRILALT